MFIIYCLCSLIAVRFLFAMLLQTGAGWPLPFLCVPFFLWLIRPLLSGRWWLQGWWSPLTFIFQLAQSPPTWTENQWYQPMDWFKGKCYLETIDFPMKIMGLPCNISLKPIHWIHGCYSPEGPGTTATRGKYSESSAGDGWRILAPQRWKKLGMGQYL